MNQAQIIQLVIAGLGAPIAGSVAGWWLRRKRDDTETEEIVERTYGKVIDRLRRELEQAYGIGDAQRKVIDNLIKNYIAHQEWDVELIRELQRVTGRKWPPAPDLMLNVDWPIRNLPEF